MAQILRQSSVFTARIGSFVSSSNGTTPVVASNIAISECEEAEVLKANGVATVAMAGQLSIITSSPGWMDYVFSTGDTNTVGPLSLVMQSAGTFLPVHKEFQVVEEAVYDKLYVAGASLNDIDGSGVTLHAGTHSGATVQGVVRTVANTDVAALNDIDGSGVTLHAGVHSSATVQGVSRSIANTLTDTVTTNTDLVTAAAVNTAVEAGQVGTDTGQLISGVTLTAENQASVVTDVWDRVLTGATHNVASSAGRRLRQLQGGGGYSGGAIYIDTINGTAGAVDFENGMDANPSSNLTDANTLASTLGISKFVIAPGSTITLNATQSNQDFSGIEWGLILNGQSIAGTRFSGASVQGTGTGANSHFVNAEIGDVSLAGSRLGYCALKSAITLTAASDYFLHDCYSGVAGSGTPVLDFGAVGNTNLNMRRYSGGIHINNKDGTGTDLMSLEGDGQLVVDATSGGAISLRGNFRVTNTGGATITYDDTTRQVASLTTSVGALPDGSAVTLHPGTHSNVTIQGVSNNIVTQLNTDTVDAAALASDAVAEMWNITVPEMPQAAPSATPSALTAVALMAGALRNKVTSSATQKTFSNNAGTTVWKKALSEDGVFYTEDEGVSGP